MEHIMQIQVQINEEGVLRNQRYAFTDRFTLISELLQNARRAGATRIEVHYGEASKRLCVRDDGCGLTDFQKLLSFHESGWDADTRSKERPFGVGFSKCLYAASRCIVTSGSQRVDIDTALALDKATFKVIQIESDLSVKGTQVELHDVDLPDLGSRIDSLCLGFPVEVFFNGKPLQRRLALAHLNTMPCPMGDVYLTGAADGKHSQHTLVFLQGFCVIRPLYFTPDAVNVVHLDSQQFMARLPDRDKLIDEDVQRRRIDAELKACWQQVLISAKNELAPAQFVELYYPVMRAWFLLELLNDIDVLPRSICNEIVAYPIQSESGGVDYLAQVPDAPSRQEIESAQVTLSTLDGMSDDNPARWMLARAQGHVLIDWFGLHANHWVHRHVRHLESMTVSVEAVEEQHRTQLDGRWVWLTVILCDAVRIKVGNDMVELTDDAVFHDGCIYVPKGESSGEAVRQASSFMDEHDQFLSNDMEADREALADLISRLRSVDPLQTLDSLLQGLQLGKYPLLHGKRFALSVGMGEVPGHSVDLLN
jgi:Histidine kinase-, DNA gyrase B-, and HSP90-like ATPase